MNKFHRFLSLALCLTFLLSFLFSPIRVNAITVSPDPYASTAYAVVGGVIVEGFKEGSKLIASAILSVWNTVVTEDFLNTCQGVLEIGSFFTSPSSYRGIYDSYSEGELSAGQMVLSKAFLSSVAAAYKTKTGQTLTVPDEEVTIYVPPESVWSEAELITSDRLNYKGFADLTEVNQNILAGNQIVWQLKKDLNGLELYLRTDFVENLSTEFSEVVTKLTRINENLYTQLTRVNSALGSLSDSVDLMEQSLSGDLVDLKTLYSTFGNETLAKLDTLNESIQAIDSSSLSTDFLNLYNLIAQNDSLIKKSVEALPGQISDSISSFFETQSLQLEDISNKLGTFEESFLEIMSGDLQLIRDDVSAGFADVTVALDQLELTTDVDLQPLIDKIDEFEFATDNYLSYLSELQGSSFESILSSLENLDLTASVDFQPVIDQIANSATDISTWLDSLYLVQDEYFANLNTTLTDFYNHISELYLDEFTSAISTGVSDLTGSFEDLLNDTSHLVEVDVKLGDLLDGDFLSKEVETLQSLGFVTSESFDSFVDSYSYYADLTAGYIDNWGFTLDSALTNLQTELTSSLSEIKTAVHSIAGTTTADPDTSDYDDLENKKIPLYGSVVAGFDKGNEYFGFSGDFLSDDLNGFLVAGLIFNEFADMSFFHRLIVISASIGLVGTLLGMALYAQSFNLYNRRREEAAQARANSRFKGLEVYYG